MLHHNENRTGPLEKQQFTLTTGRVSQLKPAPFTASSHAANTQLTDEH